VPRWSMCHHTYHAGTHQLVSVSGQSSPGQSPHATLCVRVRRVGRTWHTTQQHELLVLLMIEFVRDITVVPQTEIILIYIKCQNKHKHKRRTRKSCGGMCVLIARGSDCPAFDVSPRNTHLCNRMNKVRPSVHRTLFTVAVYCQSPSSSPRHSKAQHKTLARCYC